MCINFRAEGGNNDTWHIVQVFSTEPSIIRSLWEIRHKFSLKNPNQVRPVAFKSIFRGLPQDLISDIEDLKSHRYIRFNIELLEGKKNIDHVLSRATKDQTF